MENPMTPMRQNVEQIIRRLQSRSGSQVLNSDPTYCDECQNTGHKVVIGQGAMLCDCAVGQRIRDLQGTAQRELPVNVVPRRYEGLLIETMTPDLDRHPKQTSLLSMLREDPKTSLVMYGADSFGTGKSAIGWALYQSAIAAKREAAGGRLASFVRMMQSWEIDNVEPVVKPNDLRIWDHGLLFLDEFDKVKLSDFSVRQLFEFVNVAYEERQQVVIATNLSKDECASHWQDAGGKYGPAIYRRLFDREDVISICLDRVKEVAV